MECCDILVRVAWNATYTYILLLFAAAAFVAYLARPRQLKEVEKRLYAGELESSEVSCDGVPSLHVECLEGGKVRFERLGVAGLTLSGAVSLAVSYKGSDVVIEERVTPGFLNDPPCAGAYFIVDFVNDGRYHIRWSDSDSGLWCAFPLHVRQGIQFTMVLKR